MPPTLENITGTYLAAIQASRPETIQTSAEIQKARVEANARGDTSLNDISFYTANVPLYGIKDGKPFFLFGGREAFLRLYYSNIQEVYRQITTTNNHVYTLPQEDQEWAMNEGIRSGVLTRFDLEELITVQDNNYGGHFNIYTKQEAHNLKESRKKLTELIHGPENDFLATMQMLVAHNITRTNIYLLTSDYIKSIAGDNLIGQASWLGRLGRFSSDSIFSAYDCNISNVSSRLLVVRREVVREAVAPTLPTNLRDQELIKAITSPSSTTTSPIPSHKKTSPPIIPPHQSLTIEEKIAVLESQVPHLPESIKADLKAHPYKIAQYQHALSSSQLEL